MVNDSTQIRSPKSTQTFLEGVYNGGGGGGGGYYNRSLSGPAHNSRHPIKKMLGHM